MLSECLLEPWFPGVRLYTIRFPRPFTGFSFLSWTYMVDPTPAFTAWGCQCNHWVLLFLLPFSSLLSLSPYPSPTHPFLLFPFHIPTSPPPQGKFWFFQLRSVLNNPSLVKNWTLIYSPQIWTPIGVNMADLTSLEGIWLGFPLGALFQLCQASVKFVSSLPCK